MKPTAIGLLGTFLLCSCGSKTDPGSGQPPAATTTATAPSAAATSGAGAKEAVALSLQALDAWVAAQNQGKVEAYLALYDAPTFRGVTRTSSGGEQKLTFDAWKAQRSHMATTGVTVAAESPKTVSWAENPGLGPGVVEVRFTQRWKNPKYADHGPKVLHFRVNQGAAHIIYEELITSTPGWDDTPAASATVDPDQCKEHRANSEVACQIADGRLGWCKGGVCKDICGAGFSYNPNNTRCHQPRDCKATDSDDGRSYKSAQCNECFAMWCMDAAASRDIP